MIPNEFHARAAARERCKRLIVGNRCLAGLAVALFSTAAFAAERLTLDFNPDWRFLKNDPAGAAQPGLDDHAWANVSAPHTFNDVDTFDDWSLPGHRGEQNQWSGGTWYRKSFVLPDSFKGKKVFIEFEAARQVAEVYLNGKLLGVSKTGFIPFGFDLTPHLVFGGTNVLAVMCDNRFVKDPPSVGEASNGGKEDANGGPSLSELSARVNKMIPEEVEKLQADQIPWNNPHWHPAHGGLYRNVRLYVTDPLHISLPLYSFLQTAGPYLYAAEISGRSAKVTLEVPIQNERKSDENVELRAEILDHEAKPVLELKHNEKLGVGSRAEFKVSGVLEKPRFWEPDYPYLYRCVCSLRVGDETIDTYEIPFGVRTAHWDAQTGLTLNGHHLKLHGWGQKPTDEWPGLGAAQPDWLHFYTLSLMKEAGGNFVRWGHCAGPPASLTAADRLGLIVNQPGVDGESDTRGAAWTVRAAAFRDMIIYYRNHPSILIWEGGNQKVTREHARELRGYMDQYDSHGGRAYAHRRADQTTAAFMDICLGTEGGREIARLPWVEAEYDREESPRRVWDDFSPPSFGYPEAKGQTYQLTSEQYAVNQIVQFVRKLGAPEHGGGANWIFSDSTSGGRVACEVARASGEVDGVRLPKEAYYACQAMFRSDPQVHIIGHWNYPPGTKKTVYVVSNGDTVKLFVNGKAVGEGRVSDGYLFTFPDLVWEAGEIKAVAYRNEKEVAAQIKRTAGPAVALRLTPVSGPNGLRADGSDVALVDVAAVDAEGERCPTIQQRVDFEVGGPGVWRGGYNSGKTNSINRAYLDLECGINRVSIRATRDAGAITLLARAEGLKSGTVTIRSYPVPVENGFSGELPALPAVPLPSQPPTALEEDLASTAQKPAEPRESTASRFTKAFSYSGPNTLVHLEQDAKDGKNAYVDRDCPFVALPPELNGADYVQAADADGLFSAADLMEIAVKAGTVVSVAHDDRLPRPAWLTRQFTPTELSIVIEGRPMKIFQHRAEREESLTLGSNAEQTVQKSCNMYVVFVSGAPGARAERTDASGRALGQ